MLIKRCCDIKSGSAPWFSSDRTLCAGLSSRIGTESAFNWDKETETCSLFNSTFMIGDPNGRSVYVNNQFKPGKELFTLRFLVKQCTL